MRRLRPAPDQIARGFARAFSVQLARPSLTDRRALLYLVAMAPARERSVVIAGT